MKGYRTILFNVAAGALTALIGVNWPDVMVAAPWAAPLVVAGLNLALRFVTTTPVGQAA